MVFKEIWETIPVTVRVKKSAWNSIVVNVTHFNHGFLTVATNAINTQPILAPLKCPQNPSGDEYGPCIPWG